jgi:hypothetical protein
MARVAVWDPLLPFTVKLKGLGVDAVRPLTVMVVVPPTKMVVGLKVQVTPVVAVQEGVIVPVKVDGP